VTTEDLTAGLPAATRRPLRGVLLLCCGAALCFASAGALAQDATGKPAPVSSTTTAPTVAKVRPVFGDLSELQVADDVVVVDEAPESLSTRIQGVLAKAMTLLGTPYRWGGASPGGGFDCSGLVGYVFRTAIGLDLPRVSRQMVSAGEAVDRASLVPGDLVFFGRRGKVNHVGIYMGEGRFLHAPRTGRDVTVSDLDKGYWAGKFMAARRVAM
jgi:cell wall-associated NlpC family hydrolase